MINITNIKETKQTETTFEDLPIGTPYRFICKFDGLDMEDYHSTARIKTSKKMAFIFNAGKSERVESNERVLIIRDLQIENIG